MIPRWGGVICTGTAHVNNDESTAPEAVGGFSCLTVPAFQGKLTPALIDEQAYGFGDEHRAQALAVTITQSSELGTIYTPDEVSAITAHAHSLGMTVHLEWRAHLERGGRPRRSPFQRVHTGMPALTSVSFGRTKNRLDGRWSDPVLELPEAVNGLIYLRKMNSAGLASKMRFVSAQLIALLRGRLVVALGVSRRRDGHSLTRRP